MCVGERVPGTQTGRSTLERNQHYTFCYVILVSYWIHFSVMSRVESPISRTHLHLSFVVKYISSKESIGHIKI